MKFTNLFFLALIALLINPRINFDRSSTRPSSFVSCSTGWSLHWGKGLIGIYSLDTAAQMMSDSLLSVDKGSKTSRTSRPRGYQMARDQILSPCD